MNVNYFQLTQRHLIGTVVPVMEAILKCCQHNLRAPLILIVKVYMMSYVMIPVISYCVPNRQVLQPPAQGHVFTQKVNSF